MKNWISCVLLLYCTAVTVSQSCTQEGVVEIIGTVTPTLIAGRLEIYVDRLWRAVYDDKWGDADVRLVCNEREFPSKGARYCTSSCFGASNRSIGYTNFVCAEANSFAMCNKTLWNGSLPHQNAGIICKKPSPDDITCPNTTSCPNSTPCPDCTSYHKFTSSITESIEKKTNAAVSASLGTICALLLLTLVGVVVGWVWSQHRSKLNKNYTSELSNPCYEPTQLSVPPSLPLYTSLGAQDTPTSLKPPHGEGLYDILIETKSKGKDKKSKDTIDTEYSMLHHSRI